MSMVCPKCGAQHSGATDSRGWGVCKECAFCWKPNAKAEPAEKARPSKVPLGQKKTGGIPSWGTSDEYAPLDGEDQPQTEPLTVRPGGNSGANRVISDHPGAGLEAKKRSPAPGPDRQPVTDFDSELFDRAEREAQSVRAGQDTITQSAPTSPAITCPVCGSAFAPYGSPPEERQTCPQCNTGFSLRTGEPVSGASGAYQEDRDPLLGRTIRGCHVDRKVGEGGMGSVYHARQLSLDRSVAIKVMPAELARNRNFIQRFEREAKSLARINHPHILHIYDFGEDQEIGIYFMIIEFVDGQDLGEVLRNREVIDQTEMLDIVRQALLALEMASSKGVIHRDIKPDNLMIAIDGTCKVSDFGLAKGYGDFTEVTSAGVRVGTPAFMSPEQCDGIEVDARSDVYSLGCTAFLALTGHLPFSGDSPFSIMLKHKTEPPPSTRVHRPEIDARVDSLIRRMLAKKPDDRCHELGELINEVEGLQISLGKRGGAGPRKSSGERPRSLDESGAARLIPDISPIPSPEAPPGRKATEVPLSLGPEVSSDALPPIDMDSRPLPRSSLPAPKSDRQPSDRKANAASSADMIPMEPLTLMPELPRTPPVAAQPPAGAKGSSDRQSAVGRSTTSRVRNPKASSSSALLHVRHGDEAMAADHPSEAIRQYQEAAKRKPSKEIGGRIADARKHQRHADADRMEAQGDELASSGRSEEAIDAWLRASQQQSQIARREQILSKVDRLQRSNRHRGTLRVLVTLVVLCLLAGVLLWQGTPRIHAMMVENARQSIPAGQPPVERIQVLEEFISTHQPWSWYQTVFRTGYDLPALKVVGSEIEALRSQSQVQSQTGAEAELREFAVAKKFTELVQDSSVPWKMVIAKGEEALRSLSLPAPRASVEAGITAARTGSQSIEEDIAVIQSLRSEGKHVSALERVAGFTKNHPRAGSGLDLPGAGRLDIKVTGGVTPRVIVDGIPSVEDPAVFCRDARNSTLIEVTAPGFLAERRVIPPGKGDVPVVIELMPGVRWRARITPPRPWYRLVRGGPDSLTLIGPPAIVHFDLKDGSVKGVIDRSTIPVPQTVPNSTLTWIGPTSEEGFLVASSDGILARFGAPTGEGGFPFKAVLRKDSAATLAWIERQMVFQPERRIQFAILYGPNGGEIAAFDGTEGRWRHGGLSLQRAAPFLAAVGDRVVVVDDNDIRGFDEDGAASGGFGLTDTRSGPLLQLAKNSIFVIPTDAGVDLVRVGVPPRFFEAIETPDLTRSGKAGVAVQGDDLLVADGLGSVRMFEVKAGGLVQRWQAGLPPLRKAGGLVALAEGIAVVVDDAGTMHCFSGKDGSPIRRYEHPASLTVAPLPLGEHLLVLDGSGVLTSYHLPR